MFHFSVTKTNNNTMPQGVVGNMFWCIAISLMCATCCAGCPSVLLVYQPAYSQINASVDPTNENGVEVSV